MIEYGLTAGDDIAFTGTGWDAFALMNGGLGAIGQRVVGRSLWDFVAGAATRRFYEDHFMACRTSGEPATLVFRCDGGEEERVFCQRIIPTGLGTLRLQSRLVRARERFALQPALLSVPMGLRQCSVCLSCSTDGRWWAPPARFGNPRKGAVFWMVCPDCRAAAITHGSRCDARVSA